MELENVACVLLARADGEPPRELSVAAGEMLSVTVKVTSALGEATTEADRCDDFVCGDSEGVEEPQLLCDASATVGEGSADADAQPLALIQALAESEGAEV